MQKQHILVKRLCIQNNKYEINDKFSCIVELRAIEQCTKTNSRSSPRENKDSRIKSTKGNIYTHYICSLIFTVFHYDYDSTIQVSIPYKSPFELNA